MGMTSVDSLDRKRLAKLRGMFGSDYPGERANAAAAADQLVRQAGLRWPDVLQPRLPPAPGEPAPWAADDRDWFDRNRDRSHRLRGSHPGEWPPTAATRHTAVRQLFPGARQRVGITLSRLMPEKGEAPEAAAWAIFDLAAEHIQAGNKTVTTEEILARWAVLETEGRA